MYFGYFLHSKLVTQKCSGVKQASRGRGVCVLVFEGQRLTLGISLVAVHVIF